MANVVIRKGQMFPGGGGGVSPDDFEESSYISTIYGSIPTSSGEQLSKTNVYSSTLSGASNKIIAYGGRHGTDMGILDTSNDLDDYEDGIEYVLGYGYDENGVLQFGRATFGGGGGFDPSTMPTLDDLDAIIGVDSSATAGKMDPGDVFDIGMLKRFEYFDHDDTYVVPMYFCGDDDLEDDPFVTAWDTLSVVQNGIDAGEIVDEKPTGDGYYIPVTTPGNHGGRFLKRVPIDMFTSGGEIDPESYGVLEYPLMSLSYGYESIEAALSGDDPKVGWTDMMNELDYATGLYGLYVDASDPTDPVVEFGMLPFDYVIENTIATFEDWVEEADFVTGSDKIDTLLFKDQRGDWKKTDRASFVANVIDKSPFGPDNTMWNGIFIAPWFDRDTEKICDIGAIVPYEVPEKQQDEIFNYKLGYYDDPDNSGAKSLVFTKDDGSSKSVNMFINDSIHLKTPYDFENMIPTSNPLSNMIQVDYYTNHELSIWPAAGGDYLYWEIPSTGLAGKDIEFGMSEWFTQAPNASTTTIWYIKQDNASGGSSTTNIVYGLKIPSQVDGVSRNCGTFRVNDSGNPIRVGIKFISAGWYNSIYKGLYLVDLSVAKQPPIPQDRVNLFPTSNYNVTWTWESANIMEGPIPEMGYNTPMPFFGGYNPSNWSGYRKDITDTTLIDSLKGHTLEMGVLYYYHIISSETGEEVTNYNPYRMILGANSDTPNVIRPNTKTKSKVFNKEIPCIRYTVPNDATQISIGWMVDAQQADQMPVSIAAGGLYLYDLDADGLIRGRDTTGSLMKFGFADGDRLDTIIDSNMLVMANKKSISEGSIATYPEIMTIDNDGNKTYPYYSDIVRHCRITATTPLHPTSSSGIIYQNTVVLSDVIGTSDGELIDISVKGIFPYSDITEKGGLPKVSLSCTLYTMPDTVDTYVTTISWDHDETDGWDFTTDDLLLDFDFTYKLKEPKSVTDPYAALAEG